MAFYASGILVYGFELGNDEEDFVDDHGYNEDMLDLYYGDAEDKVGFATEVYGLEAPCDYRDENDPESVKVWNEYWDKQTNLMKEIGMSFEDHGHYEESMYLLAITESVQSVTVGNINELGQAISSMPEWREKIMKFCQKTKIKFIEPQFLLCSSYG